MVAKDYIRKMIDRNSAVLQIALTLFNRLPFNNIWKTEGGKVCFNCALIRKSKMDFCGQNNVLEIGAGSRMHNCCIHIVGNGNRITIGKYCLMRSVDLWIEDDDNEIIIGEHSSFEGDVHLACIEGTKIHIGTDCMFSANISIRTGDSHSITDMEGKRINPSRDVSIGNHVWVGNTVLMTKGVAVPDDSVVGTGSVVTRKFEESHIIIAGNPARVVKQNIAWERPRLPL